MYKFSFRIQHKSCAETELSKTFPRTKITILDIQVENQKKKQYLYSIEGEEPSFISMLEFMKNSKSYKSARKIKQEKNQLIILVELEQQRYIQNIIQKHKGFFIDLHTVSAGYEYWHIGVIEKDSIKAMRRELEKEGKVEVLSIRELDFVNNPLSEQQSKVLNYAYKAGYYEEPRKITILQIAKKLHLSHATVGEHLIKAENKLLVYAMKRLF